jgi:hypothetical protein
MFFFLSFLADGLLVVYYHFTFSTLMDLWQFLVLVETTDNPIIRQKVFSFSRGCCLRSVVRETETWKDLKRVELNYWLDSTKEKKSRKAQWLQPNFSATY